MAHPNGTHSYVPSGRFSFRRSYIAGIRFRCNVDNVPSFTDGLFTITSVSSPSVIQYVELNPNFVDWSSNGWTLDHVITGDWYVILPSPVEHANNGHELAYIWDSVRGCMALRISFPLADQNYWFPLAGGGGGYWLDPVPS
jgi:hypothetical protein